MVTLKLVKFGEMLISRPSGRDSYYGAKAYLLKKVEKNIDFDFSEVKVLTPSWIDEFISLLKKDYPGIKIKFSNTDNPSVTESLKMIR